MTLNLRVAHLAAVQQRVEDRIDAASVCSRRVSASMRAAAFFGAERPKEVEQKCPCATIHADFSVRQMRADGAVLSTMQRFELRMRVADERKREQNVRRRPVAKIIVECDRRRRDSRPRTFYAVRGRGGGAARRVKRADCVVAPIEWRRGGEAIGRLHHRAWHCGGDARRRSIHRRRRVGRREIGR